MSSSRPCIFFISRRQSSLVFATYEYEYRHMFSVVVFAVFFCGAFACDYQVGSTGSLTVVGDAAIRTNDTADYPNEDCVLRNAGVLSFPRGVSLTIAGGIEQTPTGVALVNLPPPLYLPFPGVSYEDQRLVVEEVVCPVAPTL